MLKKAAQQGRSERRGEAYASVRGASERRENAAGGLFQHPARRGSIGPRDRAGATSRDRADRLVSGSLLPRIPRRVQSSSLK